MSDPDATPDPMDKAYVEAEAVLDDAAARAARRARVLAAVAQEPAGSAAASAPSPRRPAWRSGRWLAAACVAGLGVLVATQIYHPASRQPPIASTAPAPASSAAQPVVALPGASAASQAPAPAREAIAAPPTSPPVMAKAAPPPPPPELEAAPAPQAFPAAAPAPPPPPPSAVAVTGGRRQNDEALAAQGAARGAEAQAPRPAREAPRDSTRFESLAGLPADQGARLRAAAAAGRTAEVEDLLAEGAPVDAADTDGDTALMKSIQADQAAAAALLRRHGASLDRKNHAGESARDMARSKGEAALDEALGLGP